MTKILNTYHLSYPDLDELGAGVLTVLVGSEIGDLACYTGIVKLNPSASSYESMRHLAAEKVARSGNKEPFERAKTFYPYLKKENYRD